MTSASPFDRCCCCSPTILTLPYPAFVDTATITVRCRLILRSQALSVVYGTALAPTFTSFFFSSLFLFFSPKLSLDACRTLSPLRAQSLSTTSSPKYDTDTRAFVRSIRLYLLSFSQLFVCFSFFSFIFFCSILIIIPVHLLSRPNQRKMYYSFVKTMNSFSLVGR